MMMGRLMISKWCPPRVCSFTANDNDTLSLWISTKPITWYDPALLSAPDEIAHTTRCERRWLVARDISGGYIDYFVTVIPKRNIPAGVPITRFGTRVLIPIQIRSECLRASAKSIRTGSQSKVLAYLPHLLIVTAATICTAATYCRLWIYTSRQIHAANNRKNTRTWGRRRWQCTSSSTCCSSYNKKEE